MQVETKGNPLSLAAMLRNGEMQRALGSGLLMLTGWAAEQLTAPGWLVIALYLTAYGLGGASKAREGLRLLVRGRELDVNLLMIAAASGAASIGYWSEGAMLIFIFALSGALESCASEQSKKDISALAALRPETAWKVEGEEVREVPAETLQSGDLVFVRPDDVIPADGLIDKGESYIDQSSITGESVPVLKAKGEAVFAGTLNVDGALYVQVSSPAEGTLFDKIIRLVEQAENEVPESQRFIKRLEGIYAWAVVAVTAALLLLSPWLLGWSWNESFYKSMVFLVVASPCAMVASVMPAMLSAMSRSARRGVLFKAAASMDRLAGIQVAAFDKTGTLTLGHPVVTDIVPVEGWTRSEVLAAAAAVEQSSGHPLAEAVVTAAKSEEVDIPEPEASQLLPGRGMTADIEGKTWFIGRLHEDDQLLPSSLQQEMKRLTEQGCTLSAVQCEGLYAGIIGFRDEIRPEANEVVQRLRALGIHTVMLTGDRTVTAAAVAAEAGVDVVHGDLLPEEKLELVKELGKQHGSVAMIGDGVNDAPALAAASVGIAIGDGGSGAALDVADVVLMNGRLDKLADTVELARRSRRIVKQNLVVAGLVILVLITVNFLEHMPLPLGVIGHEGSTILVILNGLRLLR